MPIPEDRQKPKGDALQPGDRVAYSRDFLRSIFAFAGDMPHARGEVKKLVPLGETTLAEIDWDRAEMPARVNVKNLCRVGRRGFHE